MDVLLTINIFTDEGQVVPSYFEGDITEYLPDLDFINMSEMEIYKETKNMILEEFKETNEGNALHSIPVFWKMMDA